MNKVTVKIVNNISPFHWVVIGSLIVVLFCYRLYTQNVVKFKTFQYEMVDGKPVVVQDPSLNTVKKKLK